MEIKLTGRCFRYEQDGEGWLLEYNMIRDISDMSMKKKENDGDIYSGCSDDKMLLAPLKEAINIIALPPHLFSENIYKYISTYINIYKYI